MNSVPSAGVAYMPCYRFGAVIEKRMTDKQFQKILDTLTDAHRNYLDLLQLAEDEIVNRYGVHPSDIDNDQWIDSYHQSVGHMTIKHLDESMKLHMK